MIWKLQVTMSNFLFIPYIYKGNVVVIIIPKLLKFPEGAPYRTQTQAFCLTEYYFCILPGILVA